MSRYIEQKSVCERLVGFRLAALNGSIKPAEELLRVYESSSFLMGLTYGLEVTFDIIGNQPTADVVEVVRCKDCIYYRLNLWSAEDKFFCQRWLHWIPTGENDFCSYGKKVE